LSAAQNMQDCSRLMPSTIFRIITCC